MTQVRKLGTAEAVAYILDPRRGPAFEVMGYNVTSDGEDDELDGVTIDEIAMAYDGGTTFDAAAFADYGPFELWFEDDPGLAQPASIEEVLYLAFAIGEYQEAPARFIKRMVWFLREFDFLREDV